MSPTLTDDQLVLSWASTLEPEALEQARVTASLPFVVTPLALMADARSLVDEHPLAYKDIDVVMEDQRDLVRPLFTLHQVLNYKGVK